MQWFDRKSVPVPEVLKGQEAAEARSALLDFMRQSPERRRQTRFLNSASWLEGSTSLKDALSQLFRNRCAFCEARDTTSPYHFRPISEAFPLGGEEEPHLYYSWLETAWENLYSICKSCRPAEPKYFPVSGQRCPVPSLVAVQRFAEEGEGSWWLEINESPSLVDPCSTKDFHKIFSVRWDGELIGTSKRGLLTIEHFHLNAPDLVEARARRFNGYWERLLNHVDLGTLSHAADLFEFQELEFGGSWYLLLRRMAKELARQLNLQVGYTSQRLRAFFTTALSDKANGARARLARDRVRQEDSAGIQEVHVQPKVARMGSASLVSVTLTNFKAIESLAIKLPVGPDTRRLHDSDRSVPSLLILGENAAGKSSLLEAVALTLCEDRVRQRIRSNTSQPWELIPSYLGGNQSSKRQAEVLLEQSNGGALSLRISGNVFETASNAAWERLPVFAYGAFRKFRPSSASKGTTRHVDNLFFGSDLNNPEAWLLSLPNDRFDMVVRALREILSVEGDFDVVERDFVRRECFVVTSVPGSTTRIRSPLSAVSSGFRSVLAMACDVMDGLMTKATYPDFGNLATARGVVLIDEVEAHLHPRWKMQIMGGLRRALPQITFIATTHDPLSLRGMEDGEAIVLHRVPRSDSSSPDSLPLIVEALVDLPRVSRLRVEQLLTSDFFQLHSTDAPQMDKKLARIAEWLAKDPNSLDAEQRDALEEFHRDLASALPIGTTEAHRLVQEAVIDYLKERRAASQKRMGELRATAKQRIIAALRGSPHA